MNAKTATVEAPLTLREQLLKAASGTLLLRVTSLVAMFIGSVVLARALGPAGLGVYSLVFAIVTLLALPAQVGIPTLLVRETAKAQAKEDWSVLSGLWRWSTRIIFLSSMLITLGAFLVVLMGGERLGSELVYTLMAGLVLVPLIALGNARGAALRGLRFIVRGQLPETVIRPVLLLVFVGGLLALGANVSSEKAMALHAAAAAIAFLIGAALLWRARPNAMIGVEADFSRTQQWLKAAIPLALIGALQIVSNQAGILLLGGFRAEDEVGIYKVATSAATLTLFGLQVVNLVMAPHMARLHAISDFERLQRLASVGAMVSSVLVLPALLVFIFIGDWLLALVYGAEFKAAYLPLIILTVGQVINALFGSVGLLLNMTGHERAAARWLTVSVLSNIGLGVLLIPQYGVLGAAVASVASLIIWNIAFWQLAKNKLGVDGSVLPAITRLRRL